MSEESLISRRPRRTYSRRFKAEMVAQCLQGDVSLAALAVEHGMNPNVLHRWVKEHERYGHHCLDDEDGPPRRVPALVGAAHQPTAPFVPLPVSASTPAASHDIIRLEVKRDTATVRVSWPISAAAQCAALLREWLR